MVAIAMLAFFLASAVPAFGQPTRQAKVDNAGLPFTGLDIGLLAGAGGLLLVVGLGMRRITRPAESS
jgi:hypothetical protein